MAETVAGYLVINVLEAAGHDSEDAVVWEPEFKQGYARSKLGGRRVRGRTQRGRGIAGWDARIRSGGGWRRVGGAGAGTEQGAQGQNSTPNALLCCLSACSRDPRRSQDDPGGCACCTDQLPQQCRCMPCSTRS